MRDAVPIDTAPTMQTGGSWLVLNEKQAALLIGEMGSLSASNVQLSRDLAALGATMGRMNDTQEQTRRIWERNTEAALELTRKADDLERAFTALTIETARGPNRR